MRSRSLAFLVLSTFLVAALPRAGHAVELKLATLAPRASSWMAAFKRADGEVRKLTAEAVQLKLYPGGTQGDEPQMVAAMRAGKLDGAALSAVGLAKIAPEALVLVTPGLATDPAALRKLRDALAERLTKALDGAGFVALAWGDVGELYLFSEHAIRTPAALSSGDVKLWAWSAEPVARQVAKTLGLKPVDAKLSGVRPRLEDKRINAFFAAPLSCLSLQWCAFVKHRLDRPLALGAGAIVVRKASLAGLDPAHRAALKEIAAKTLAGLTRKVRRDNERALKLLEERRGVAPVKPTPAEAKAWTAFERKVQEALVGKLYPRPLLDEARKALGK